MADTEYVLDALLDGQIRAHKVVAFPGARGQKLGLSIALYELTDVETKTARLAAIRSVRETWGIRDPKLSEEFDILDEEVKVFTLYEALRDPRELARKAVSSVSNLRLAINPDERDALYNEFLAFVDEISPFEKIVTSEKLDEVIATAGKGMVGPSYWQPYDIATLRRLATSLAARAYSSECELSLVSRPPIEPSDTSTTPSAAG